MPMYNLKMIYELDEFVFNRILIKDKILLMNDKTLDMLIIPNFMKSNVDKIIGDFQFDSNKFYKITFYRGMSPKNKMWIEVGGIDEYN